MKKTEGDKGREQGRRRFILINFLVWLSVVSVSFLLTLVAGAVLASQAVLPLHDVFLAGVTLNSLWA